MLAPFFSTSMRSRGRIGYNETTEEKALPRSFLFRTTIICRARVPRDDAAKHLVNSCRVRSMRKVNNSES
jgi:hypothetical protein